LAELKRLKAINPETGIEEEFDCFVDTTARTAAQNKLDSNTLQSAIYTALTQAKASGEFDGADGKDGTSVTVSNVSESTADGGSNVVTFSDGKKVTIKNGSKGSNGAKGDTGASGVGIKSVVQTTTSSADGGSNVITVTKTDNTTSTFTVKNGSKGSKGDKGDKGDSWVPQPTTADNGKVLKVENGVSKWVDNTLVVNISDMTQMASHTPDEILAHLNGGGNVVLNVDGSGIASLSTCTTSQANFTFTIENGGTAISAVIIVNDDKSYSFLEVGAGGGGDTLIVTVDENMVASHSPAEVYEHISGGGTVIMVAGSDIYTPSVYMETTVLFTLVVPAEDGAVLGVIVVNEDKSVSIIEMGGGGGDITVDDALDENSTNPVQNKVVYEAVVGIGQTASEAYNYSESASMAATAAQTLSAEAKTTANRVAKQIETPDYVKNEAESVIDRVLAAQTGRTFTFAAITDLHYGNGSYTDGVVHACQAMKYIDERVKLDAVAVLGDYTDGYPADGLANAVGDFKAVNGVLDKLRFADNLRQQGNHDYYANNFAKTHRFIQAYSDDVVWGDKLGGYYYRDFDEYKLRVISVNTVETGNANVGCSTAQYNWFISSLDLSAKEDAAEWQILILSHHPLDWYPIDETYRFCYILEAYKNGASWSGGGVSCNFAGKNTATLIGNIHGHIHNLLTGYINRGNINTSNPTDVLRMCTPEACINRANQYTGGWADTAAYNKTKDTAKDTSFCVYCIDLDSYTITAVCYGAGYDRNVKYFDAKAPYTNQIPISKDSSGNIYNGVGYKTNTRLNSSGAEAAFDNWEVTGFIPITTESVVRFANIDWNSDGSNKDYLAVYDSNFTKLGSQELVSGWLKSADFSIYEQRGQLVLDSQGLPTLLNMNVLVGANFANGGKTNLANMAYFRISCCNITGDSIITVDEEIV
jgi:hypothetical protein